jgi:lipid II:glycine glycyltransferase (peptidoglycan interpeptide bridge formation enzyme)
MSNSTWQIEVDRATSAEWSQMLDLFEDASIYQTAAYGEVRWGQKNLSRIVLKRDGEVAGIAQLRIIRPTPLKFGMAYLRWGPLWERRGQPLDFEVSQRLAHAIEEEYAKKRKLFVCILPNAFSGSQRAEVFQSSFSRFTSEINEPGDEYRTFVVDLSPTLEKLRSGLDAKWRNKLKGAEKNNLTVVSGEGIEEYQAFREMFSQMHKRKGFETSVDVDEFGRMQQALSESQRMRVLICQENGVPVAGLVVSAVGNSAIYLLGATSDAGLKSKGAYLLHWTMMCWLKERGITYYDLGGIDPERNPGVYYFKRGFSGVDCTQIKPYAVSDSVFSSGMAKAGVALQRALRASFKPRSLAGAIKEPVAGN